jgi:hypothetical protein
MRVKAFSSQVESLGGSENAVKQEHFQAKWNHLAARKMRSKKGLERFPRTKVNGKRSKAKGEAHGGI